MPRPLNKTERRIIIAIIIGKRSYYFYRSRNAKYFLKEIMQSQFTKGLQGMPARRPKEQTPPDIWLKLVETFGLRRAKEGHRPILVVDAVRPEVTFG